jgi:hypothetical protein
VLKWAVNYENSVIVVKQLLDLFNSIDDPHFNLFKKDLLKKLEDVNSIIADEIESNPESDPSILNNLEILFLIAPICNICIQFFP